MINLQLIQKFIGGATSGRTPNSALYIDSNVLFSYGEHYPLAVRTVDGFIVNSTKSSRTTNKQKNMLKNELNGVFKELPTNESKKLV